MGTLYTRNATIADVKRELTSRPEIVMHRTVGSTLYTLERLPTGDTYIGVYLLKKSPDGAGYKNMDESMHPYYYDCPAAILDAAGPPPNTYAAEWRARCREALARAKAQRAKSPKPGEHWTLEGSTVTDVEIVEWSTQAKIGRAYNGKLYNIPPKMLGERVGV